MGALHFLGHHNGYANSIDRYGDGFRSLSERNGEGPHREGCHKSGPVLLQWRKESRSLSEIVFGRSVIHDEAVWSGVVNISRDSKVTVRRALAYVL